MKRYSFLENTADIKIRATGKNNEESFTNCAYALKEAITRGKRIEEKIQKDLFFDCKNKEELLYKFLEEFIYLLEAENFILSKVKELKINGNKLNAKVSGDSTLNYKINNEVKAITYSEILVKEEKGKFICEVVFDV